MLLYYLFWMITGFVLHFYIIFGTNLLTGGPTQIVFFAYFSVSQKRNIKRSTNGMKPSGAWFLQQTSSNQRGGHRQGGALHPRGPLVAPPTYFFLLYIYPYTLQTSRSTMKPYFHHRNLLYPRGPILGPFPELRRREHRSRRASTSTPWPLQWCVSSLPQTFGSIASS